MSKIPKFFREQQQPTLVNFSFQDWVQDVGYGTYYAVIDRTGAAVLSPFSVETDREYWKITKTTASGSEEWNFDLTFEKPAILDGRMFIVCTYGGTKGTNGGATSYEDIEVFHVTSGGTETTIGTSQTTETFSYTSDTNPKSWRKTLFFDISRKVFSIGEKLRIEVTLNWTNTTSGTSSRAHFWFDGANRAEAGDDTDGTATTDLADQDTDFKVFVPFKVTL